MTERKTELTHLLLLLLGSVIWGAAFVAQSDGAEYVGPLTFLAIRSWLAFFFLIPVILILRKHKKKDASAIADGTAYTGEKSGGDLAAAPDAAVGKTKTIKNDTWKYAALGGLLCGFFLFVASFFQQAGIAYTTTAKAGFITALYVVIVPIISVFVGQRSTWKTWVCAAMGVTGLYLLCMTGGSSLSQGDILMLLCAFTFSLQIMSVNHFVQKTDGVLLAEGEFLVEAVFATVFMLIFETPTMDGIMKAAPALLYTGIMSGGVGYTLQIVGQEKVNPAVASLAMGMESVFAALSGWILLGQAMTPREITGALIMFAAVVLTQIPIAERDT